MAAITWSDVLAHAAELSTVPVAAQAVILGYVNESIAVDMFGGEDAFRTKLARVYLAAHFGAVGQSAGAVSGGGIAGESAGGLSRSYFPPSVVDSASLGSTSYGQAYLQLIRASVSRAPFVP